MSGYGCPICGSIEPHVHDLGTVLNSRYFCADGERHQLGERKRRLLTRRPFRRCERCGEAAVR